MTLYPFLDLPISVPSMADVLLLPLPYEGSVTYGEGTGQAPAAISEASTQIESWDEEIDFDLESLHWYAAPPLEPKGMELPESYLHRVYLEACGLAKFPGLLVGIGGEHSVTPPLVRAVATDPDNLSNLTVVQFDAHADLRDQYLENPHSHACAMRRLVELGARVIAIGIRSAEREEWQYGLSSQRVETFTAAELANEDQGEVRLRERLAALTGRVYLTFDIAALDVHLCPATGTPQPGGLTWWPTMRILQSLFSAAPSMQLVGADLVETVPLAGTRVNEITAARLLCKLLAYHFKSRM